MSPETHREIIDEYRAYVWSRILGALQAALVSALGIGTLVWLMLGGLGR